MPGPRQHLAVPRLSPADRSRKRAVSLIASYLHAARVRAEDLRRSAEGNRSIPPPSYALGHAAAEMVEGHQQEARGYRLRAADADAVAMFMRAFVRMAAERAALEGDDAALAMLHMFNPRLSDEVRARAAAHVEEMLAEMVG